MKIKKSLAICLVSSALISGTASATVGGKLPPDGQSSISKSWYSVVVDWLSIY